MSRAHVFEQSQRIKRPIDEVFGFFCDASNLEALTPSFLKFRILTPQPIEMQAETRIDYALSLYGVPLRWRTRISEWEVMVRLLEAPTSIDADPAALRAS